MNNIKKIRKVKKITLRMLSSASGISCGYLSHLENGTRNNPSYEVMKKIAFALDSNIGELFS